MFRFPQAKLMSCLLINLTLPITLSSKQYTRQILTQSKQFLQRGTELVLCVLNRQSAWGEILDTSTTNYLARGANVATVLFSPGFLLHDDNKQPQQGSDGQLGVECQNPHFSKFFFVFHLQQYVVLLAVACSCPAPLTNSINRSDLLHFQNLQPCEKQTKRLHWFFFNK